MIILRVHQRAVAGGTGEGLPITRSGIDDECPERKPRHRAYCGAQPIRAARLARACRRTR